MSSVTVNVDKVEKMLEEWKGVLRDRGKLVGRLRDDLKKLQAAGQKADIEPVFGFYDAVLKAGKAAGKVELLESLLRDLKSRPGAVKLKTEHTPGDDPRLVVDDDQEGFTLG